MEIIDSFEHVKTWLAAPKGIQSLLHVHAGLILYFIFAALMPRRYAPSLLVVLTPFLLVAAIQLSNEVADYLSKPRYRWTDGALDSFNTLFWPLLLTLVFWRRDRVAGRTALTGTRRGSDPATLHRRPTVGIAKSSQATWQKPPSHQAAKRNIV